MKRYISVLTLCAILLTTGCTSRDLPLISTAEIDSNSSNAIETAPATEENDIVAAMTEIALEEAPAKPQVLTEPPVMRIETIGTEIASCTNMYKCGYSWDTDGQSVIACGASPYQAYELGHINAVINIADLVQDPKILLTNGGEIGYVYCWGSDEEVQEVEFTDDGCIILPDEPVGCVYEVSIDFPQGQCSYVFATELREIQDTYSGDEMSTPAYDPTAAQSSAAYQPEIQPVIEDTCGYPTAENMPANGIVTDPVYKIIRTNCSSAMLFQGTVNISSADELAEYIDANDESCYLDEFKEYTAKYDEDYFKNNALVLILLEANSGSITYEIESYSSDGNISINSIIPMVGTCDMAYYHAVLEIPQSLADVEFGYAIGMTME